MEKDGFPAGPWTPDLLAEAISQIDSNRIGIDLRTVQLWFQENGKGISATNIVWLARIFGCDDHAATSAWQIELSAAQTRLTSMRRSARKVGSSISAPITEMVHKETVVDKAEAGDTCPLLDRTVTRQRNSLAMKSEAFFSRGSPLNLSAWVFAGITGLGFLSYIIGIHSVTYDLADGGVKQVGFLWTVNWTFVFMGFLPLFFWFVTELITFWTREGRFKLASPADKMHSDHDWACNVDASSYTYWAVFLICVFFAGLFQWIGVALLPLINGGGNYATDWGTIATVRPDAVPVTAEIIFTGLAYLYMCVCYYLFFAALILLHTLSHDLWKLGKASVEQPDVIDQREFNKISVRVMHSIFRCTLLGFLIAIVMKLQSSYLTSSGENIVLWLVEDMSSAFDSHTVLNSGTSFRRPTHYSSLLIAISTGFVFLYAATCLGSRDGVSLLRWRMSSILGLLFISYLLVDAFVGFSILLGIAVLLAIYGLVDPALGRRRASELGY